MDLSIIIVSWNVRLLLERCLASIVAGWGGPGQGRLPYEVIVVDNGSTDGSDEAIPGAFPWVRWWGNETNAGFTKANNQGLALSQGRYLLLLNPDTEVIGESLQRMVQFMDEHPDVGALGPKLLYPNGAIQSSRRRFPTYATGFVESTVLQGWLPNHPLLRRYYMRDIDDDRTQDVDWVIGACMLIRREAYEQVGPLDERFFMYSEELDYAFRLRNGGWRIVYLPSARVIHHEAKSSDQVATSRWIMFHTSKVQFYTKVFGRRRGEALRLFLLATFVYQWGIEGLKWLVGHRRALRAERMAAYRQVLRSRFQPASLLPPHLSDS